MGKELNSLIAEARLTALTAGTNSASKLHEHERRMEILVKKIDRQLSQVKSDATRNTIVQKLNLKRLPEAIGKLWRKLRQRRRRLRAALGAVDHSGAPKGNHQPPTAPGPNQRANSDTCQCRITPIKTGGREADIRRRRRVVVLFVTRQRTARTAKNCAER